MPAFIGLPCSAHRLRNGAMAVGGRRPVIATAPRGGFVAAPLRAGAAALRPAAAAAATRRLPAVMAAAGAPQPAPPAEPPASIGRTVAIGLSIALWWASNVKFNIANKRLLKVFPLFLTLTTVQFGMGAVVAILAWSLRLRKWQTPSRAQLRALYPLALVHVLGNVFTNLSLRAMAVSLTHTLKASEPFFSVVISKLFIPGTVYTGAVYASLVPIVFGVTMASVSDITFSWFGFFTAMGANIAFQSRNVLSKRFMNTPKEVTEGAAEPMGNFNTFAWISILSFLTLAPFALLFDAAKWSGTLTAAGVAGWTAPAVALALANVGFLHWLYNQASYLVLVQVNPVTHAVGNTMKRGTFGSAFSAVVGSLHAVDLSGCCGGSSQALFERIAAHTYGSLGDDIWELTVCYLVATHCLVLCSFPVPVCRIYSGGHYLIGSCVWQHADDDQQDWHGDCAHRGGALLPSQALEAKAQRGSRWRRRHGVDMLCDFCCRCVCQCIFFRAEALGTTCCHGAVRTGWGIRLNAVSIFSPLLPFLREPPVREHQRHCACRRVASTPARSSDSQDHHGRRVPNLARPGMARATMYSREPRLAARALAYGPDIEGKERGRIRQGQSVHTESRTGPRRCREARKASFNDDHVHA